MIEAKRVCEQCREVILETKPFYRITMELIALNGSTNPASAFIGADFCGQGCVLARVKAMLAPDGAPA